MPGGHAGSAEPPQCWTGPHAVPIDATSLFARPKADKIGENPPQSRKSPRICARRRVGVSLKLWDSHLGDVAQANRDEVM